MLSAKHIAAWCLGLLIAAPSARAEERTFYDHFMDGNLHAALIWIMADTLISEWKFPVLGRREDALDQFSMLLLSELNDDLESEPGMMVALLSVSAAETDDPNGPSLDDAYRPEYQRFFNALCMIYGQKPDEYQYLIEREILPAEAERRCPHEYEKAEKNWGALVTPITLPDPPAGAPLRPDPDHVRIVVDLRPPKDKSLQWIYDNLKRNEYFQQFADNMNMFVDLPERVTLVGKDCDGSPTLGFDAKERTMLLCYELISNFSVFAERIEPQAAKYMRDGWHP